MLLIGLGDLSRLTLRLSLLYRPFLRAVRLEERGEILRRGLELDLDLELGLSSENGDRVRGRPREGDREGILEFECRVCLKEDARIREFREDAYHVKSSKWANRPRSLQENKGKSLSIWLQPHS